METTAGQLKPGYMLDRYELLCPIASGGMASVWLARLRGKRGFEKLFAIKTIRTELTDDPRFEQMFLDEARIASTIHHSNVAQILDLGEFSGILYIVMEWVDGEPLAKVRKAASQKKVKIPLGVTLRVLADACAGLHAAHEVRDDDGKPAGVIHRDVSPQNLLVATSGSVKVIDFGVAKAENRGGPRTRTGIIKGKIQYMPPEQARGEQQLDRRVDVWAIGVCLYELACDRLPFDGDHPLEVLQRIVMDPPPPIGEDIPEPVVRIVAQSLARDREERFSTAAAQRRAIETAMSELGEAVNTEDIAAFVAAHMPERAQQRKQLVAQAIKEAGTRDAVAYTGTVQVPSLRSPPTRVEATAQAVQQRSSGKMRTAFPSARAILEGAAPAAEGSNPTQGSLALTGDGARRGRGVWLAWLAALAAVAGLVFVWRFKGAAWFPALAAAPADTHTAPPLPSAPPVVDAAPAAPSEQVAAAALDAAAAAVPGSASAAGLAPSASAAPSAGHKHHHHGWPPPASSFSAQPGAIPSGSAAPAASAPDEPDEPY